MGKPLPAESQPPPSHSTRLLVTDGEAQAKRPLLGPRPPFLLRTHPQRWGVIAGKVVPICGHIHLRNAVHLMRQRKDGTFAAREAIADWENRGWTVLKQDIDGESYLREVLPGVWLLRWEHEHMGSDHVSSDEEGYATWLRGLIAAGKIPGPLPYVLDAMAAKLRQAVGQLRDDVRAHPSRQPELDRAEADLKAIEDEITAIGGAPAKPTKSSRKALPIAEEGADAE